MKASTRAWTHDELRTLRVSYGSSTNAKLATLLGRTADEIEAKASELALAKDKRVFTGTRKQPRWSAEEEERLRALFPDSSNRDVAIALNRSVKAIIAKADALGLKKSRERIEVMGRENVGCRRDRGSVPMKKLVRKRKRNRKGRTS